MPGTKGWRSHTLDSAKSLGLMVLSLKRFIHHSPSSQRSAYSPTIHPPVLPPIHPYTIYPSIYLPTYSFSIPDIRQLAISLLTRPSFFCPFIYYPPSHLLSIHPSLSPPPVCSSIHHLPSRPLPIHSLLIYHSSNCLLIRLSCCSPVYHPIHPIYPPTS